MAPEDAAQPRQPTDDRRDRLFGKYRGTVVDTLDPKSIGRITALVPEVLGGIPTGWATPCAPYAGLPSAGFFSVPAPGAGVWIEFEAGDVSRPIWSGCYWGVGETPMKPPGGAPPNWTTKIWRSELGLTTAFDDATQTITISDATTANAIEIDATTGTVTIRGLAKVVVNGQLVQVGSEAAAHPAVFGDQLLAYLNQLVAMFNAHIHPGELALGILPVTPAPPTAPIPPPSPSILSRKVLQE